MTPDTTLPTVPIIPKLHITNLMDVKQENSEIIKKIFEAIPNIANILGVDKDLELEGLDNVVLNTDLLGTWASIDFASGYQFTSNERDLIKNIKEVAKDKIGVYSLYINGNSKCNKH